MVDAAAAIKNGVKGIYYKFIPENLPNAFLLEDFLPLKGKWKIFARWPETQYVVLCSTSTGDLEVRTLSTFARRLSLSYEEDETITDVEGQTTRSTLFTHLKKIHGAPQKNRPFSDEQKKAFILKAFYQLHGYKVRDVGDDNNRELHWV